MIIVVVFPLFINYAHVSRIHRKREAMKINFCFGKWNRVKITNKSYKQSQTLLNKMLVKTRERTTHLRSG